MATITQRTRADGTTVWRAQIRKKEAGKIIFSVAQTFERESAAIKWADRKEKEISTAGGLEAARAAHSNALTIGDMISGYIGTYGAEIGRTKSQVLRTLQSMPLADLPASRLHSKDLIDLAVLLKAEGRKPQTVLNYMSHLGAVLRLARPVWKVDIPPHLITEALDACKRMKLTAKSAKRDRRPTVEEMDKLMAHFHMRSAMRPRCTPMAKVIAFALYSTRRQEEILRIEWKDLEAGRVLVRDMKNPGDKQGNHIWCDLPPEAEAIARSMPRKEARIFPYSTDAVSAAFTRACHTLGILDLRFHDLRHEGASRLFEMGWNIPQVASVSGHRSWQSLQRYTHVRQRGDKWAEWQWLQEALK